MRAGPMATALIANLSHQSKLLLALPTGIICKLWIYVVHLNVELRVELR